MASVILIFSKQQDTQILCRTGYDLHIMVSIQTVRWLYQSMPFPSYLFINEIWARRIISVQFGQEAIINGDNIRWKYPQWRLIALITQIRYFFIPLEIKHLNWHAQVDIDRMEGIRSPRHNVGFIYRSFTVKNVHTISKRHQSFNPMNLLIG